MKSIGKLFSMGLALCLALIACGIAGYYWYNNHHISSDFKRTLSAAVDPTASEDDQTVYVRDARLQVHTAKDEAIFTEFQEMQRLDEQSLRIIKSIASIDPSVDPLTAPDAPLAQANRAVQAYVSKGQPAPLAVRQAQSKAFSQALSAQSAMATKAIDDNGKRIRENNKRAFALWSDVRHQLNLVPLKSRH